MQEFGVSTRWILQDDIHFTSFAFVSLMEDGERDFVFNRGADGQLSREEVEEIDLDEVSIIHFGSATGFLPGPCRLLTKVFYKKHCKKIFLSASIPITGIYFSGTIHKLLSISRGIF
jgi:sugar/nucleoside kinase (ribokinase family)